MATYLKFHQLERSPFEGRGSDQLVLATASLRRAYAEIKSGLEEGSPRICLSGGAGIGKSSFARALPKLLDAEAHCVLVREAGSDWDRIKSQIAKQLQLEGGQVSRTSLLNARRDGKRIVLVIDEAEDLPEESLEHLDVLLGYRDDGGGQLVQSVLLADLEEAPRGKEIPLLWWLDQLTTRQLSFAPIPEDGIRSYVEKRLKKAGFRGDSLFADDAITAIYRYTGGVPGAVSALCEELLSRAAHQRQHTIDRALVARVCGDRQPVAAEEPTPPATPPKSEKQAKREVHPLCEGDDPGSSELPRFSDGRRLPPASRRSFAAPEPELEIQQGLVHMDEPDRSVAGSVFPDLADHDDDPFSSLRARNAARPSRRAAAGYTPPISPGSGRGGRLVRNLIGIAVLACLAMVVHILFFSGEPAVPRLTKPIPPPKTLIADEPAEARKVEPKIIRVSSEPRLADDEAEPQAALELEDPSGLTSDLRLDPSTTNAAALAESAGPNAPRHEPASHDGGLSLRELEDLAQQSEDAVEEPEPWAEQAPEPTAVLDPSAPPSPAAPAPHP